MLKLELQWVERVDERGCERNKFGTTTGFADTVDKELIFILVHRGIRHMECSGMGLQV